MSKITSPMDPFENPIIEFDFSDELDGIDTAAVSIQVTAGVDAAPGSMIDGAHQITGTKVYQRFSGGLVGVDYKVRCEVVRGVTKRVRAGILPVRRA